MAKNLLISGCSTGIGRACALHFAKNGYRVFACVRKQSDADSLAAADGSGNLEPMMLDVTDVAQLDALKAELDKKIGTQGLAGLINNAGVARGGPLEYIDPQIVRDVFNVNLMGPLLLTQAFLPLIKVAGGRVITIGSIAGKVASPMMGPYCISKFAVEAFCDTLRQELAAQGIHVALVEPGPIETPMLNSADEVAAESLAALTEQGRRQYGDMSTRVVNYFHQMQGRALPPQAVADVVEHALQAQRPRTRYLVTFDAKLGNLLHWLLPDRAFDFVTRKMMA